MNTTFWGPAGWIFLHTITFNYPEKITKQHGELPMHIKNMFENLQHTLPCKYCRASFSQYMGELPIEPFLGSRKMLTLWLYLMHNKVNGKLRKQERALLKKKVKELRKKTNISKKEFQKQKEKLEVDILYTREDPKYEEVCQFYESHRAGCHADANKIKSCRL